MSRKALKAQSLRPLLEAVRSDAARMVAPVEEAGKRLFREVETVEAITFDEGNTVWSFKEFLFPRAETLFRYRLKNTGIELEEPALPEGETVIFGARPCDAASVALLDAVFAPGGRKMPDGRVEPDDPFYPRRRAQTTIIGVSCAEPGPACFCTAVGLSPTGTLGSDVLLTRVGEEYLVEASTEKGERFLEQYAQFLTETEATKSEVTAAAEAKIRRTDPVRIDLDAPLPELFKSARLEEMARACLGCGACAFICPTCHCFDIADEGNAVSGSRCKFWDSCGQACFTMHTSGHNPRPNQPSRYRNRLLHKLRYIPERFGVHGCVGCGRCALTCPVNMDIYEVARAVEDERETRL
ncbi:MAG: hypothetical protein GX785_13925 [Armatimonadetes bacterium]|nr:hypothetical protein [Armatimonadota bacterium]